MQKLLVVIHFEDYSVLGCVPYCRALTKNFTTTERIDQTVRFHDTEKKFFK